MEIGRTVNNKFIEAVSDVNKQVWVLANKDICYVLIKSINGFIFDSISPLVHNTEYSIRLSYFKRYFSIF